MNGFMTNDRKIITILLKKMICNNGKKKSQVNKIFLEL